MKLLNVIVPAAVAMLATMPAGATIVIDQSQAVTTSNGIYTIGNQSSHAVQSFTAGASNSVGAGVYLSYFFNGWGGTTQDPLVLSLYSALPGTAGAQLLASASGAVTLNSWNDLFWDPVSLVQGQQYYLEIASAGSFGIPIPSSNPYAGGSFFFGANQQATSDAPFRTYTDNALQLAAVPEASSWALMLVGFGAIGGTVRRQRRTTSVRFG